jgi:hypothetical protein
MDYNNRRYLVIPIEIVDDIDFNQVLETSKDTLRLSVDKTKTFVKYYVTVIEHDYTETFINVETNEEETYTVNAGIYGRPQFYSEEYQEYTHDEFIDILQTEEWLENNQEI